MIKESADFFEDVAKGVGLTIKIPRPGKALKRASAVTNSVIGTGLLIGGIVVSRKVLVALGALGLVSAVLLVTDNSN